MHRIGEGRLLPAVDGDWQLTDEGSVELTLPGGRGMLLLHICGPAALLAGSSDASASFLRVLPGATCWPCLVACINASSAKDELLLMLDAPDPEPEMRRQLTKEVNGGAILPGIVFGSTHREIPRWTGQFAAQLSARGYRVCVVYLGAP